MMFPSTGVAANAAGGSSDDFSSAMLGTRGAGDSGDGAGITGAVGAEAGGGDTASRAWLRPSASSTNGGSIASSISLSESDLSMLGSTPMGKARSLHSAAPNKYSGQYLTLIAAVDKFTY